MLYNDNKAMTGNSREITLLAESRWLVKTDRQSPSESILELYAEESRH